MSAPSFYSPDQAGRLYVERVREVAREAEAWKREVPVLPSSQDRKRICALGVDVQVAFCHPDASLFVPGAIEDTGRTLRWLYENLGRLTELIFTLDTHYAFQIFHPAWWADVEGNPPAPFTQITAAEVRAGRWRPTREAKRSCEYVEKLEATGKYVLTIWPYHALLGGPSHSLMPAVREAALFHSLVRRQPTRFEQKGIHPLTEHYSVMAPEVTELGDETVGVFNQALFEHLSTFDRVYIFGQAKSHCVLWTLFDLWSRAEQTGSPLLEKLYVLEDAMSPVPAPPLDPLPPALDFPRMADLGIEELREAGAHIVRTTDSVE